MSVIDSHDDIDEYLTSKCSHPNLRLLVENFDSVRNRPTSRKQLGMS
jgi:hypothetical protein